MAEKDLIETLFYGLGASGRAKAVIIREGGVTVWDLIVGKVNGVPTVMRLEATGEQPIVNYGEAGGIPVAEAVESTGEQKVVNYGKDSGANLDPLRTNDNQQLFYEPYEKWDITDPVELTNADAIVLNPGGTATDIYSVTMTLVGITGVAPIVTVYVDVAAGGTPANNEYLLNAETLSAGKLRLTLPEIIIGGDDDIRAFTSAGNDVAIHFKVKQVARM